MAPPAAPFYLLARVEGASPEIAQRLVASFNVQVDAEGLAEGTCVLKADTKPEAEARISDVLRAGAGYLLLDATGMVLSEGAKSPGAGATLLGVSGDAPPSLTADAPPSLTGGGLKKQQTLDQIDLDALQVMALDGSDDAPPDGAFAPPAAAGTDLEGMVSLGGSMADDFSVQQASAPPGLDEPPGMGDPPPGVLELDHSAPPGLLDAGASPGLSGAPGLPDAGLADAGLPDAGPPPGLPGGPPGLPDAGPPPGLPGGPPGLPDAGPVPGMGSSPGLAPPPPPAGGVFGPDDGGDASLELLRAPVLGASEDSLAPLPDAEPEEPPPPSFFSRLSRPPKRVRLPSRWLLADGYLRLKLARVRVLAGFILALGLGAILPMCHASSVVSAKVEPARKELSRATAYRATLQGQPGYRSPEEIGEYISSVKWRGATFTFVIWLVCGGLLGFAWFYFT